MEESEMRLSDELTTSKRQMTQLAPKKMGVVEIVPG
jgi:hypothetical protein